MQRIRILRIITRLNIGGPAVHSILLTAGLNRDCFGSVLITGKPDPAEGQMSELLNEKGIKPVSIPQLRRELNPINDLGAFLKIYSFAKKYKPHIIHTHTAKAGTLGRLAGLLYNLTSRRNRCKIVHTFHGHVLEGYFGRVKNFIFVRIEKFLAKFTDRIIVVSPRVKEDLLRMGIGDAEKIEVIYLGLELGKFLDITSPNTSETDLKIGIIGRLVPVKNHGMFLDAAAILKDYPVRFFIIGDGELMGDLKEQVKEMHLDGKVILKGWQMDLVEVYSNLDIVALTSWNEGTPLSIIEAMAASRPVIATDVGGVRDLLGNNQRGILVNSADADGLAEAIKRLAEDASLRVRLGRAGRDFVKGRFAKERLIKDVEMLYNNFLKKELNPCMH